MSTVQDRLPTCITSRTDPKKEQPMIRTTYLHCAGGVTTGHMDYEISHTKDSFKYSRAGMILCQLN